MYFTRSEETMPPLSFSIQSTEGHAGFSRPSSTWLANLRSLLVLSTDREDSRDGCPKIFRDHSVLCVYKAERFGRHARGRTRGTELRDRTNKS